MPKVTFKGLDGLTFEAELTLDQIKELAKGGSNGNGSTANAQPAATQRTTLQAQKKEPLKGDWGHFINSLSARARKFLSVLRKNPSGIEAMELAVIMGFNHPSQLGGVTGPGLSKLAEKHGIKTADVYRSETAFPGGVRKRLFFPGKLTLESKEETPLF